MSFAPPRTVFDVITDFLASEPSPEEILALTIDNPNPPDVTAPGLIYRLFTTMAVRQDLFWLSTATREEVEQSLGK